MRPEIADHSCDKKLKRVVQILRSENADLKARVEQLQAELAQAKREAAAAA